MEHTKGKWKNSEITFDGNGNVAAAGCYTFRDNSNASVDVWYHKPSEKSHAISIKNMIDKAPEMYEALKDLIQRYPNSEWITLRLSDIIKEIES